MAGNLTAYSKHVCTFVRVIENKVEEGNLRKIAPKSIQIFL